MSVNLDKVSPGVEIELGGKKRSLVFDFLAFCLLEKRTGKNCLAGEMFTQPSATEITSLIWAGIQHEGEVSFDEVARCINLKDLPVLGEAIKAAFEKSSAPSGVVKKSPEVIEQPSVPAPSPTSIG